MMLQVREGLKLAKKIKEMPMAVEHKLTCTRRETHLEGVVACKTLRP